MNQGQTQSWTLGGGGIWILLLSFICKKFLNVVVNYFIINLILNNLKFNKLLELQGKS